MPSEVDEVVSVGVDYLTATFMGRKECRQVASKAFDLVETEMSRGNYRKPFGMAGFSGWQAGPVQVGHRHNEVMVRLSSHAAHEHWRWFSERARNVSRADFEVTTRTDRAAAARVRSHWRQARRYKLAGHSSAAVGAYFGDDSTPTCYLGRRVSNRFGRIYDKENESRDEQWQGCVRYEVEYKNDAASRQISTLLCAPSEADNVVANVLQFFQARGVRLKIFSEGQGNYSCIRKSNDAGRTLQWFSAHVKPSLARLREYGLESEGLKALGIILDQQGNPQVSPLSLVQPLKKEVA